MANDGRGERVPILWQRLSGGDQIMLASWMYQCSPRSNEIRLFSITSEG